MGLEGPHSGFFVGELVVVAEEVKDAVDDQEGGFALGGVAGFGGLALGLGEGDYDVAEVRGVVGGRGEDGVGFVRGGLGVVVALPRAGVGGGEGEDVGDFVLAAVLRVEGEDCVVVAEGDGELAVLVGEGDFEGGEGGPSEEFFGKG